MYLYVLFVFKQQKGTNINNIQKNTVGKDFQFPYLTVFVRTMTRNIDIFMKFPILKG